MKLRTCYTLLLLSFHFYVSQSAFFINSDGATRNRKDKATITDKINILPSISGSSVSVIEVPQEDNPTSENDAATVVNVEEVKVDAVVIYSTPLPSNGEEKNINGSNHSDKDDLLLLAPNEGASIAGPSLKIKVAESSNESELDESDLIGNNNISQKQNQQTDLVDGIPKIKPHIQTDKSETITKSKPNSVSNLNHHQANLKAKTNKESNSNDAKTIKSNKELIINAEQAKKEPTISGIDEENKMVIHSPLWHGKVHDKKSLTKSSKAETTKTDTSSKEIPPQKTFSHKKNLVSHKNKPSDKHKNSTFGHSNLKKENFKKDLTPAETPTAQEIVLPAETQLKKHQDQKSENNLTGKQKNKKHEQRNHNSQKLNKLELPTSVQVSILPQIKDIQNEKLKEPENSRLELSSADKESPNAKEELTIKNNEPKNTKEELSIDNKELQNAKLELSETKELQYGKVELSSEDKEPEKNKVKLSSEDKEPEKNKVKLSSEDKEPEKNKVKLLSEDKEPEKNKVKLSSEDKEPENIKVNLSSKDKEPEKAEVELSSKDKVPKDHEVIVSSKDNPKNKQEKHAMKPHPIFLGNKTKQKHGHTENTVAKESTDEQIITPAINGKSNSKDLTNAINPTPNEIANKQVIDLEQSKIKQLPEGKKTASEENSDVQADKNVAAEEDIIIPEPMKSNNLAVIAISMTLILTTLLLTLVGVYFRKISLERRRYVGHTLLGTEDDLTLFNRETYHDDVVGYDSWNSYSH